MLHLHHYKVTSEPCFKPCLWTSCARTTLCTIFELVSLTASSGWGLLINQTYVFDGWGLINFRVHEGRENLKGFLKNQSQQSCNRPAQRTLSQNVGSLREDVSCDPTSQSVFASKNVSERRKAKCGWSKGARKARAAPIL